MRTWHSLRSFPLAVQLLVLNQLGVNVGFYLLLPYLALYLTRDLGLTVAVTGLFLGVRNLAQQGMTLLGGSAGDRFGFRPVIVAGLALRTVAFGCFALLDSVAGVVVATILTGLAGALFAPAVRAYISVEAGQRRAEAFALFQLAAAAGMLAGPLLGALLITVDFRVMAATAAIVFAALATVQLFALPARAVVPTVQSAWQDWKEVILDRRFVLFTMATSTIFALHNQFYLTLPLEVTSITGVASSTALIFAVSTLVTITVQVRLNAWCRRRFRPGASLAIGMGVSAVAFVPLVVTSVRGSGDRPVSGAAALVLALVPLVLTTAALGVGEAIGQPFAYDRVGALSRHGLSGTYFGLFTMMSGIGATAVNTGVGYVRDVAVRWDQPWLTWLVLLVLGTCGAASVAVLQRRGHLEDRVHPTAPSDPSEPSEPVGPDEPVEPVSGTGRPSRQAPGS